MTIAEQLGETVTEAAFTALWPDEIPPFDGFMAFLGRLLVKELPADAARLEVALKRTDQWRIRVDGGCGSAQGPMLFYAEIVWLPPAKTYRGTASARPAPKGR